ncbi:phage integrase family protein [Limnohabitans sp.]|jgi:site-specific recombinase XerD|uniref:phage integrase family protein n=1 Tax=Limnohabitans sp. TaxID=1907725 RepID=UPI00391A6960
MNFDSILRPKITLSHLALAKGWANGLELADLGPRYFPAIGIDGHAMDLRQTKTTLLLVMQELALAATRAGIDGGASLVRSARQIRPDSKLGDAALPSSDPAKPSFEAFLDTLDHADSFSEEELLAAYEDRYPAEKRAEDRAQARRSRLVRRQLDLIGRLQLLLSAPIQLTDSVDGWFDEKIASRLLAAGIKNIEDLAIAIAQSPQEWHDEVVGIGETKARRIESFLQTQGLNLDAIKAKVAAHRQAAAVQSPFQSLDLNQLFGPANGGGTTVVPPAIQIDSPTKPPAPPMGYDDRTPLPLSAKVSPNELDFEGGTTVVPPSFSPSPSTSADAPMGVSLGGYDRHTPLSYPASSLPAAQRLNGSLGRFRHINAPPVIDAANDYEAMKAWLKNKKSPATVRVYEREIMRLIAWSVGVRGRAVISLMHEDALAFRDFLSSIPAILQTKKGPASTKDRSPLKEGVIRVPGFTQTSLSPASITKTLVIISGFFTWLQAMRYTTANPFQGVRAEALGHEIGRGSTDSSDQSSLQALALRTPVSEGRSLPQEVIEAIDDYLDSLPKDKESAFHARVRFIFYFAYFTGLRISEIAEARRAALGFLQPDPATGTPGGWYINIVGKGNKHRRVSVNDVAILELERYLAHRGLITLPCPSLDVDPGTFLIGGLVTRPGAATSNSLKVKGMGDGVRPQTIHLALKRLFRSILNEAQFRDPGTLEKVRKASAHWLRHTSATHALANGVPIEVVSGNLGHASLDTTSIYIDSELRRNIEETRQGWARALAAKETRRRNR